MVDASNPKPHNQQWCLVYNTDKQLVILEHKSLQPKFETFAGGTKIENNQITKPGKTEQLAM